MATITLDRQVELLQIDRGAASAASGRLAKPAGFRRDRAVQLSSGRAGAFAASGKILVLDLLGTPSPPRCLAVGGGGSQGWLEAKSAN